MVKSHNFCSRLHFTPDEWLARRIKQWPVERSERSSNMRSVIELSLWIQWVRWNNEFVVCQMVWIGSNGRPIRCRSESLPEILFFSFSCLFMVFEWIMIALMFSNTSALLLSLFSIVIYDHLIWFSDDPPNGAPLWDHNWLIINHWMLLLHCSSMR